MFDVTGEDKDKDGNREWTFMFDVKGEDKDKDWKQGIDFYV